MTVLQVQEALLARGFNPGPLDGDPGPLTIAAFQAFQKASGLVSEGLLGPLSIALLQNGAAPKKAIPAQPGWLTLARAEIGTVEGIGASNNPIVVAYFRDAGFAGVKDDATAWCAAFVGAMLTRAGHKPSGSLAARSYEMWGISLNDPVLGCIATKKRAGSAWQGHVGLVVGASKTQIFLLGGNQSDSVSIAGWKRSEFTSFRWPKDVPIPVGPDIPALPMTIAGAKSDVSEA